MNTLVFQIESDTDDVFNVRWCITNLDSEHTSINQGELSQLAEYLETLPKGVKQNVHVIVLLPDEYVLYVRTSIPGSNQNRIRRAAPYAIEQYLTDDIEKMHVAVGQYAKARTFL